MPLTSEGGGHAIVLLKQGELSRSRQACQKMVQTMSLDSGPADGRPTVVDGTYVYERPVYWPVAVETPEDCTKMVQNYDFQRAAVHLQRIPNWSNLGQGPFVLVKRQDGKIAGLFDFSKVAGADFDKQFAAVVNYMSKRPDVWDPDFYHEATFRENLRRIVIEGTGDAPIVVASLFNLKEG